MIHEGKLQAIMQWLSPRLGVETPRIAADLVDHQAESGSVEVEDAIAVINVGGTLVNRGAGADGYSGLTSYEWLSDVLGDAEEDPCVKAILLRFDSYGGEVSGVFDCADIIAGLGKPTWAVVDDNCYSAAYLLASQCDYITVTRTAGCGSIGVIAVHVDQSGYDAKTGVKYTPVFAGAKKNDFSPHQPLAEEPLAWLQAEVEKEYEMFCEYVSRGRGMSVDAVKATQAGLYTGAAAVGAGLADAIATYDQAETMLGNKISEIGGPAAINPVTGGSDMSAANAAKAAESPKPTASQDCPNSDCPMKGADCNKDQTNMQSERARIAAILNSPEANGREQLARTIAFETDMNAEAAAKLLAASPKASVAPANPLAAEMAKVENPNVGTSAGAKADSDQDAVKLILSFGKETN